MTRPNDLLGHDGKLLHTEPRLIVLKYPKNSQPSPNVIANIGKMTECSVIVMPMDSEILMGRLASEEIQSVHVGIHAITQTPYIQFSNVELKTISAALKYVQERTAPSSDSIEVLLIERITKELSRTR